MPQVNGNNHSRRLEFLERVYLGDRKRWDEDRHRWRQLAAYIRRTEDRWRANDERFDATLAELKKHAGQIDAMQKTIHRMLEGRSS